MEHPKRPGGTAPGAKLKALRRRERWTLSDVAVKTDLPISTLSRLENGKMAMTYEKLLQISAGLGIDISVLIGTSIAPVQRIEGGFRRTIVRAGEGQSVETPTGNYLYVATDLLNKAVTPIIGDVTARRIEEYGEYLRHSGEEYLFVLNGTLALYTEAYAPVRLEQGDSIYFDSGMGHAYVSVGDTPCKVLSICSANAAEAHDHLRSDGASVNLVQMVSAAPAIAGVAQPRNARKQTVSRPASLAKKA